MLTIFLLSILLLGAIGCTVAALRTRGKRIPDSSPNQSGYDPDYNDSRRGHWTTSRILGYVAAGLFGLAVLIGLSESFYTQGPGHAKVIVSFTGSVVDVDTTSGLGFKWPWQHTVDFDIRNQTVTYVHDGTGKNVDGPAITAQDKDNATATIDSVVRYDLIPSKSNIGNIYRQFGDQESFQQKVILNDVRAVERNIPLNYHTSEFRLNRAKAAVEIQDGLSQRWENQGITVQQVDLRDIRYPDAIEQSLQAIQTNKNQATAAVAALESAKAAADKTRIEAKAQADADQIIRCGAKTTTVTETINGVETRTVQIVPLVGGACQNRLNDQVLMSKYIDMLREAAASGNTIYVVPPGTGSLLQLVKSQSAKTN